MKIAICIVLYNCSLVESRAVQSLLSEIDILDNFIVNIYLNGICNQDCKESAKLFRIYDNGGENLLLLKNYQNCIKKTIVENVKWIVFFDQDTEISIDFLKALIVNVSSADDCVAYFPILKVRSKIISPRTLFFGSSVPSRILAPGKYSGVDFVGLNSGSVYRVDYLSQKIDLDKTFGLDFLDCFLSYQIYKDNVPFKVLAIVLEHDLSVMQNKPLAESRARSILSAESHYFKIYRSLFENIIYKMRVFVRLFKSFFNKNYLYQKSLLIEYLFK